MSSELIKTLNSEVELIGIEILNLIKKKEALENALTVYGNTAFDDYIDNIPPIKSEIKSKTSPVKKTVIKKSTSGKIFDNGKLKVSQFILNIFKNSPKREIYPSEICKELRNGIVNGICNNTKKDVVSCVSAYIWNFQKRGAIIRVKGKTGEKNSPYKFASSERKSASKFVKIKSVKEIKPQIPKKAVTESAELEGLSKFDELLSDLIYEKSPITTGALVEHIRNSEDYLTISRTLSETLLESISAGCQWLCKEGIITKNSDTGEYRYVY